MKQFIKNILKKQFKKIIPARGRELLKTILTKLLLVTKTDINYFYDDAFATASDRNKAWAKNFCAIILKAFSPESVIDFGCGTGDLLYPFEQKGIGVLGIDASRANRNHCIINKEEFILFDLRNRYKSEKKYGLCLCLEVAEHIEEKYSDILINNLAQSSSSIVFSAAPPGQLGTNHINLKPYDWWIKKFEGVNFKLDKSLTEYLKQEMANIPGIYPCYINNLLVFQKVSIQP